MNCVSLLLFWRKQQVTFAIEKKMRLRGKGQLVFGPGINMEERKDLSY